MTLFTSVRSFDTTETFDVDFLAEKVAFKVESSLQTDFLAEAVASFETEAEDPSVEISSFFSPSTSIGASTITEGLSSSTTMADSISSGF